MGEFGSSSSCARGEGRRRTIAGFMATGDCGSIYGACENSDGGEFKHRGGLRVSVGCVWWLGGLEKNLGAFVFGGYIRKHWDMLLNNGIMQVTLLIVTTTSLLCLVTVSNFTHSK